MRFTTLLAILAASTTSVLAVPSPAPVLVARQDRSCRGRWTEWGLDRYRVEMHGWGGEWASAFLPVVRNQVGDVFNWQAWQNGDGSWTADFSILKTVSCDKVMQAVRVASGGIDAGNSCCVAGPN